MRSYDASLAYTERWDRRPSGNFLMQSRKQSTLSSSALGDPIETANTDVAAAEEETLSLAPVIRRRTLAA